MWRTILSAAVLCSGGAAMAQTGAAGEAKQVFDAHWGPKIAAVAATVDTSDDAALAAQLLDDVKLVTGQPALELMLYESAAELGQRHFNGYASAIDAMRKLMELTPGKAEAIRGALIELLQRQYVRLRGAEKASAGEQLLTMLRESGSEYASKSEYAKAVSAIRRASTLAAQMNSEQREPIRRELEAMMHRQRAYDQITQLRRNLEADASDAAKADKLIRLFVVDLDDPQSGARYAIFAGDSELKRLTPLLAAPIEQVPTDDLLAAGEWYRDQANQSAAVIQPALLSRAKTYLQRYVSDARTQDLQRVRGELALRDVSEKLAALAPAGAAAPAQPTPGVAFDGVKVTFEAEKAESIREPMKVERTSSASGGAFVWEAVSADEVGNNASGPRFRRGFVGRPGQNTGEVTYLIQAKESGDFYLWARVRTPDAANDSFYLTVETEAAPDAPQPAARRFPGFPGFPGPNGRQTWSLGVHRNWTWVPYGPSRDGTEAGTIRLEQGGNTITIQVREPGAMLDALHISKAKTPPQ